MSFTIIPLDTIDRSALRLVTFASQGMAESFLRSFLAAQDNEVAFLVKSSQRGSLRNAICKVAGISKPIKVAAGTSYTIQRGDRKGTKVTAKYDRRETFTANDYAEACKTLGITLSHDPTRSDATGDVAQRNVALVLSKGENEQ
jgi:hypothetical protein